MGFGFLNVEQTVFHTSQGNVGLPILYKKTASVTALFTVPATRVVPLLAGKGLVPVQAGNGDALVPVVFFRYDETSIGSYNEAALAVVVTREGEAGPAIALADLVLPVALRRSAVHILDLPVTTAVANAAGREIWGYPKFVTDIPFTLENGHVDGSVLDPETRQEIVRLDGDLGVGVPSPGSDLLLYSHLDGELVRTQISVRALQYAHRGDGVTLHIGPSKHPMAERLRALGLEGASPKLVQSTHNFRSRLPAGVRLTRPW